MDSQTRQKEASKSFKAPTEKGLTTTQDSLGVAFIRKKPRPVKELKEEFK